MKYLLTVAALCLACSNPSSAKPSEKKTTNTITQADAAIYHAAMSDQQRLMIQARMLEEQMIPINKKIEEIAKAYNLKVNEKGVILDRIDFAACEQKGVTECPIVRAPETPQPTKTAAAPTPVPGTPVAAASPPKK